MPAIEGWSAVQFAAWLERRGWSDIEAAEQLGTHRTLVWKWRKGKRIVPRYIVRLCQEMDAADRAGG